MEEVEMSPASTETAEEMNSRTTTEMEFGLASPPSPKLRDPPVSPTSTRKVQKISVLPPPLEIEEEMNSWTTEEEPWSSNVLDRLLSPTTSEAVENDTTKFSNPPSPPKIVEEMNSSTTTEIEYSMEIPDPTQNPITTDTVREEPVACIPIPQPPPPPPPPPPPTKVVHYCRFTTNHPCPDLVERSIGCHFEFCVPLYEASITGDWEAAMVILKKHPDYVRYAITEGYDTALHVAASAEETKTKIEFVRKLVAMMKNEDLELQNWSNNTAFCSAAAAGNFKMVKIMMERHAGLLYIAGDKGMPLYVSVVHERHKIARYLYNASSGLTGYFWTPYNRGLLLLRCVEYDLFDVALKIVKNHSNLPVDLNLSVLQALARKPNAFEAEQNLLRRIINSIGLITKQDSDAREVLKTIWTKTIKEVSKSKIADILRGPIGKNGKYSSGMLFVAAKMGNAKFVTELLRAYPGLIWTFNDDTHSIFHVAVMNRCHDIYNLLYEIGTVKDRITQQHDKDGNNMFHLVGKTSSQMRPQTYSASLLMQRELLWFKEIEKMVPPFLRQRENNDGKTPYELFSEANKDLVIEGLIWMKDCMIVATLIVTVTFAVAFTVPGGYSDEKGFPIFMHECSFLVFAIADAISLFSSSISLVVFLSIFTSRHRQHDFMYTLPRKLMIGLVTLLISVAAMMITFAASFFVLYRNNLKWVPMLVGSLALTPVIVFAALEYPLLMDIFLSIYDSRYLFNPRKRMLYNRKPML